MLIPGGREARYVATGQLIYALDSSLFGVAFDPDTHEVSGGTVPLVQGVMGASAGQSGVANYDVSNDGTLVYVMGNVAIPERSLVWVDRAGRETPLGAPPRTYAYPRISPDETKVALDTRDADLDIWSWDFSRQTLDRVTVLPSEDEFPVWSPDGRQIAFSSSRDGGSAADSGLYVKAADGTGTVELLAEFDGQIFPTSFLPDGSGILVRTASVAQQHDDIAIVRFDDDGDVTPLLSSAFNERNADISPDGRWLAYSSDVSGREEIYVRPFPDYEAERHLVSTDGGMQPLWARRGTNELFYRNGDAMMAVSYETDSGFAVGTPQLIFEGDYMGGQTSPAFDGRTYDYAVDNDRFLMIRQAERDAAPAQIIIVQNWFTELERLAPTAE